MILRPQRFLYQPQYPTPIDYAGLGRGMKLLLNPSVGSTDLVTGRFWTPNGNAKISSARGGKLFDFDGSGDYYTHTGYPEITSNIGTFLCWCPRVGPSSPNGHMLISALTPNNIYVHIDPSGNVITSGATAAGPKLNWFNTTNRSLVVVYGGTGATTKVYIDGEDSSLTFALNPRAWGTGNKVLYLGRYPSGSFGWDFNGTMRIVGYTSAVWGKAEAKTFHENASQIYKAPPRRIWIPASSGGSVTGTLAYTNANDTLAATGTTTVVGTLATTNANDSITASGTTTVTGSLAVTNQNDTIAASGSPIVSGSIAATNADDTLAASGSVGSAISGTLAYTNADDSIAAAGTTTVTGALAATNANDTLSASGYTTVTGSLATTNADDTLAASGTVETVAVTGTLNVVNADDTLAASGTTKILGTLAASNANDTLSASGTVNGGIMVEAALLNALAVTAGIKKPGIPSDTAPWLRTTLEIVLGRRGNRIDIPEAQTLTFSATPTQAECEALYNYTHEVRDSLEQLITRLDS